MTVTIVAGYIISKTAVITDHEKTDVERAMKPADHSNSVLYATIRESEERLAKKKE